MYAERIKERIKAGAYRLSEHADRERENDGIEMHELRRALLSAELLEDYPEDRRGHSCLFLGFDSRDRAIHSVCALGKDNVVVIITVYIPVSPKWKNPRERAIPDEG